MTSTTATKKPNKSTTYNAFLAKLRASGLDLADAKRFGFSPVEDLLAACPTFPSAVSNVPGLLLPYHDVDGRSTGFVRGRVLDPSPRPASFVPVKKALRYVQPANTGVSAYFPRAVDWRRIMVDPTQPVYLTEGELKAACGVKVGLSVIGLGGVYSWRSAKRGISFLPELDAFEWSGRHTFVIFDSDSQHNTQVMVAMHHLCETLTERGAIPYIGKLPELNVGEKTGLDDFIVARGADALRELLEDAEPFALAEALWKMNDHVCFVRDPGLIFELSTRSRFGVYSFIHENYANWTYEEQQPSARGVKLVRRSTAQEWIRWPHRLEAAAITYAPGQPLITDEQRLNTWRGSNVEPAAGDVRPWLELLDFIFDGAEPEARRWFERWCAYPLQRPGAKLLSAVVLWGVHQGTGKSLVGYSLANLYGWHNALEINQAKLHAPFNDWLVDRQLILGDEITGSDRRADADLIKSMITARTIRVNAKYVKEYTVPALANFFFTSNHPDAFFLEDTDRRFFVHEVVGAPLPLSFYARYDRWYQSDAGQAALLEHLLRVDTTAFNPNDPAYETASKLEMIEDSKSDLGAWVARLKREPDAVLAEASIPVGADLLTAKQLLAMYDTGGASRVTVNGLARELKRAGFWRSAVVTLTRYDGLRTTARVYAVRDEQTWRTAYPAALSRAWNDHFSGPAA